jgi:hypothetical protein
MGMEQIVPMGLDVAPSTTQPVTVSAVYSFLLPREAAGAMLDMVAAAGKVKVTACGRLVDPTFVAGNVARGAACARRLGGSKQTAAASRNA